MNTNMDLTCCVGNTVEYEENTYKQYYYPTSDDEHISSSPYPIQKRKRSNSSDSLDEFFNQPKNKSIKLHSSSVGRATQDGTSYITTNEDDGSNATHLIKIEIFDLKKLSDIPPEEHWKHADVRVKYYNNKKYKNNHHQLARKLVYSITKEISSAPAPKKYNFKQKS